MKRQRRSKVTHLETPQAVAIRARLAGAFGPGESLSVHEFVAQLEPDIDAALTAHPVLSSVRTRVRKMIAENDTNTSP